MTVSSYADSIMAMSVRGSYAMALRRCREYITASRITAYSPDPAMEMEAAAVSALIIDPLSVSSPIIQHA